MDFILFPYNQIMEGPLSTSPTKLLCEHMEAKRTALEAFKASSSYGTNFVSTNSKSLERDIDEKFAYYRELNESKKLGKRLKATLEQLSDNEMYRFAMFSAFKTYTMKKRLFQLTFRSTTLPYPPLPSLTFPLPHNTLHCTLSLLLHTSLLWKYIVIE